MIEDQDRRLALGKRADKLGWILTREGEEYHLQPQDPDAPETGYVCGTLDDVETHLVDLER